MRAILTMAIGSIILAGTAGAQTPPAPASANPISQSIQNAWNGAKRNIVESADQMPEMSNRYVRAAFRANKADFSSAE